MQIYANILPSASRTTTQTCDLQLAHAKGCVAVLDMTTVGTGSVTLTINGYDAASGKTWTILSGVAVVTNITSVYKVYPGLTAAANATVSDVVPYIVRFIVTANNANPAVYSLGASMIP